MNKRIIIKNLKPKYKEFRSKGLEKLKQKKIQEIKFILSKKNNRVLINRTKNKEKEYLDTKDKIINKIKM